MKVRYIVLVVIVVIMLAVIGIFSYERAHVSLLQTDESTSVSIIGGADGPTSVFLAGKLGGNTGADTGAGTGGNAGADTGAGTGGNTGADTGAGTGGNTEEAAETNTENSKVEETDINKVEETEMKMIIGDTEVKVLWENNATVDEIKSALEDGPITIEMSMYGGFEQVGSFGRSFTRDDKQTTTSAGDLVLYSGNQLVVFYGSNSWAYTRLGKIQGVSEEELTSLLSNGDVTITICKQ